MYRDCDALLSLYISHSRLILSSNFPLLVRPCGFDLLALHYLLKANCELFSLITLIFVEGGILPSVSPFFFIGVLYIFRALTDDISLTFGDCVIDFSLNLSYFWYIK